MAITTTPDRLPAISIRQPWAEFVIFGLKSIEFRSKPTKMRGRFYIYASLGTSVDEQEFATFELGMHPEVYDA